MADAKPEDIQDLLGGALFKALFKWMVETGPVYLLPTGVLCTLTWARSPLLFGTLRDTVVKLSMQKSIFYHAQSASPIASAACCPKITSPCSIYGTSQEF